MRPTKRSNRLFSEPFSPEPKRPSRLDGKFVCAVVALSAATFASVWMLPGTAAVAEQPFSTMQKPAAAADPVYYSGCNEARAAGAAPIYRGQPGYRPEMDGDDDGIACEPHRY